MILPLLFADLCDTAGVVQSAKPVLLMKQATEELEHKS